MKAWGFDVTDSVSDQVYRGAGVETARTNQAVQSTGGEVLIYSAVLLAILLIPVFIFVLFILLIVVFALIVGGWSAVFSYLPWIDSDMYFVSEMPNYMAVWGSISGILLLGIPLMALLYRLFRRSLNLGPMAGAVKWILLLVWLASLVGVCAVGVWAVKEYSGFYFETISQTLPALSSWVGKA